MRIKHRARANVFFFFFVKLGVNNHVVGLVHKKHIVNEL